MRVKFYGVRGSIPAPLMPDVLRNKIASVVQRIDPLTWKALRPGRGSLAICLHGCLARMGAILRALRRVSVTTAASSLMRVPAYVNSQHLS